jgi:four helix bundle protein
VKQPKVDLRDRTQHFALSIMRMFSMIPKSTEAQVLGKQMLRSGTSVGANYREAYRGRSRAEFVAKCGDSLRELEETAYWLQLLVDGKIVAPEKLSALSAGMRRAHRHFCDYHQAIEGCSREFLILTS